MPAEFESGFAVRDQAWHGLAKVLPEPPRTIREGLIAGGMDWDVRTVPVFAQIDDNDQVEAENFKAVIRETDRSVLGIVSNIYQPLQNREAFEFFQPFLDNGTCVFETAGSLKSGQYVWVLAKVQGKTTQIVDGDEIVSYLLLSNAHNGTRAVTIGFTPIRVVCWNTLTMAEVRLEQEMSKSRAARVLHTKNLKEALKAVQQELDFTTKAINAIVGQARTMMAKQLNPESFYKFLEQVYGPEREALRDEQLALLDERKRPFTPPERRDQILARLQVIEEKLARPLRKTTTLGLIAELFDHGPGADLAGRTLWGAVSAVTHYEEHLRPGSNESKLFSSWFQGSTKDLRQRAYNVAMQMAG